MAVTIIFVPDCELQLAAIRRLSELLPVNFVFLKKVIKFAIQHTTTYDNNAIKLCNYFTIPMKALRKPAIPISFIIIAIFGFFFNCCGNSQNENCPEGNAVYFWRKTFSLTDTEKQFLKDNEITTLYLHMFDVVKGPDNKPQPDNTLLFDSTLRIPQEIVPTVFIAESLLKDITINLSELSDNIIQRIDDMLTSNGYPAPKEIQLDYDWVQTDRKAYFQLLSETRTRLHKQGRRLSATIRLHQLSQQPPEVDYGVLMVYNIGNFADPKEKNSIISIDNLKPYLRYLKKYPLPLATALPLYDWNLLFHQDKFNLNNS